VRLATALPINSMPLSGRICATLWPIPRGLPMPSRGLTAGTGSRRSCNRVETLYTKPTSTSQTNSSD
jgi:hypothetical protein